jgi:hypothetical protein
VEKDDWLGSRKGGVYMTGFFALSLSPHFPFAFFMKFTSIYKA